MTYCLTAISLHHLKRCINHCQKFFSKNYDNRHQGPQVQHHIKDDALFFEPENMGAKHQMARA